MLRTMIIVQDLTSLGKGFDLRVPDPSSSIAQKGHANTVDIDALGNTHKILGERVDLLNLVPACHVDNALFGANQVDAHPFDLSITSLSPF